MSAVRRWTCPIRTPGSIGRGAASAGSTLPCSRLLMHPSCHPGSHAMGVRIHRFSRCLDTVAVRQSRSAENQVAHHMRSRPIDSDSAHGAESSTMFDGPRLSVLDQSPIPEGSTGPQALRNTLDLARAADRLGY